jgi:DNA polymerase III sliding clamp (beta) subunit (PCNA family)
MLTPILTAVHITPEMMEASDRFRAAQYTIETNVENNILVPADYIPAILSITPTHFAVAQGWVHFKNTDSVICSARVLEIEQKFPDISSVMNVEGEVMKFPSNIIDSIESAEVFGKATYELASRVDFTFKKGALIIESSGDFGWYKETIRTDYDGDDMEFGITPSLFKYILQQKQTFVHTGRALLFSTDNWKYLTMLKSGKE